MTLDQFGRKRSEESRRSSPNLRDLRRVVPGDVRDDFSLIDDDVLDDLNVRSR